MRKDAVAAWADLGAATTLVDAARQPPALSDATPLITFAFVMSGKLVIVSVVSLY